MKFGNNWPNYFRGEVVSNYGRTTNGRRTGGQRRMTNLPILKFPSAHVNRKRVSKQIKLVMLNFHDGRKMCISMTLALATAPN